MKKIVSLLALGACLSFGAVQVQAQDKAVAPAADAAPTSQQSKMKTCNADARTKALKGDERKGFMKECLSANKQEVQQTKMKTCNADAKTKDMKGDARKAFMKECLSNKA